MHHDAKHWNTLTDWSNEFNTVKRTALLDDVATCVLALTQFRRDIYPFMFFQMNSSGERRKIDRSNGVQYGDAMGPTMFGMPLSPVLKRARHQLIIVGALKCSSTRTTPV